MKDQGLLVTFPRKSVARIFVAFIVGYLRSAEDAEDETQLINAVSRAFDALGIDAEVVRK